MAEIIQLKEYRKKQRKIFMKKYLHKIDETIFTVLNADLIHKLKSIFSDIESSHYRNDHQMSWDYVDSRDLLIEVMDKTVGDQLYSYLCRQIWFKETWFSREQMLDRALSNIILSFPDLQDKSSRAFKI